MDILVSFIDKLLWLAFVFSVLGAGRVLYYFILNLLKNPPPQFLMTRNELTALGAYIAVIIMSIFTGIRL
jgi:hypothetical protein